MYKLIILLVFFLSTDGIAKSVDIDKPKERVIEIDSNTREIIDILPGRGVKLIFPWVLDEESEELPYTLVIPNGNVFGTHRDPGQNSITVYIKVQDTNIEGEVTDLFINVAGYHFNLTLRANFYKKKHYSTIIFKMNNSDKLELIERMLSRHRRSLENEFKMKEADLDKKADRLALKKIGGLALNDYDEESIKEDGTLVLSNDDEINFYVDKFIDYRTFIVFPVEVRNDTNSSIYIEGVSLSLLRDTNSKYIEPVIVEYELPPKINKGDVATGYLVTNDLRVLNSPETYITLLTNKGKVEVKW